MFKQWQQWAVVQVATQVKQTPANALHVSGTIQPLCILCRCACSAHLCGMTLAHPLTHLGCTMLPTHRYAPSDGLTTATTKGNLCSWMQG